MIYVTSDTHFCHNREFLYGPRGFLSVGEMNAQLIHNWNSIVTFEDDVYLLGDLMLNNDEEGARCIKQLNGHLHIAIGNHDTDNRIELYRSFYNVVEVQFGYRLKYNGCHFLLTHYPTITSNFDYDKPMKARLFNLCGHSHTPDRFADWDKGGIYHTELDAHDNCPVSLDEVVTDIRSKFCSP